jgi:hypothetical protein
MQTAYDVQLYFRFLTIKLHRSMPIQYKLLTEYVGIRAQELTSKLQMAEWLIYPVLTHMVF